MHFLMYSALLKTLSKDRIHFKSKNSSTQLEGRLLALRRQGLEALKFKISQGRSLSRKQRREGEKRRDLYQLPIQMFEMEVSGAQTRFTNQMPQVSETKK